MTEQTNPEIKPGMVVKVHEKIKETNTKGEEKERIQIFEGTVLSVRHGGEIGSNITVHKISNGVGVEKIYPLHSPVVAKIEVEKQFAVRRAKLYHLTDPKFKRKMKEVKKEKGVAMKRDYRVLVKPLITEKASHLGTENKYVFAVAKNSNKIDIAKAIEEAYGIKPIKVNIINMEGKVKSRGRITGKRKDWKKAIVALPEGKTIQVYEGI